MFGIGGSEMLVILIVALLFLGPEKLPDAASKISKGIRDLKKQTRDLTQTIENDTEIGGAIRDLKSALRGEEIRPRVTPKPPKLTSVPDPDAPPKKKKKKKKPVLDVGSPTDAAPASTSVEAAEAIASEAAPEKPPAPVLRLPDAAGEPGHLDESPATPEEDDADLAKLVRKPLGTVAKGEPSSDDDGQKAG